MKMNMLCKQNEAIERLQRPSNLKLDLSKRRVSQLRLMSFLAPHKSIQLVIYRLGGKVLDQLLRPLLVEARLSSGSDKEGDKRFKYLTYTLSNALASHVDMAWHNTTRYLPTEDRFTDIEVLVLAESDASSIQQRLVEAVVSWLSADLLRDRLGELFNGYREWLSDGVAREEITLTPPAGGDLVAYPDDHRYFRAMVLTTAERLRLSPEVAALLSPRVALEEGRAPLPALRVSSQGVDLIGEPEMRTSARWVSNVLRVQPKSEVGYGQLSVNCTLHSRVFGDLKPLTANETAQTRQLMLYRRQKDKLIMHQYPFTLSEDGANFEQVYPKHGEDLAGRSICRLYRAEAGPVADRIPLKAGRYQDVLAMPLLAQGLGDNEVAIYTGASAPERYDVFSVVMRALASENYHPLPELSLLSQMMPRNCSKNLHGVSVFRQTAITGDIQVSRSRRNLLTEFLRQRGGAISLPIVLVEGRAQNFACSGNDWMVALSRWSGLQTAERWTTPRLNREFKLMEKGLASVDRYGTGSWTLFTGRSEDNSHLQIRAELHSLRTFGDDTCKLLINESDWDRHWVWTIHAEITDEIEHRSTLPPVIVDSTDSLNCVLDEQLAFESPTPAALKIRRELLASQLGVKVAIPVFTLREDLRTVVSEVLREILGEPKQIISDARGVTWEYVELKIWLGYWPQGSGDVGIGLSSLLPKVSGSKWREDLTMHGQQRQRSWLRQLEPLMQVMDGWQVLPLIGLPWGTQNSYTRDPKPWLRDLFNRLGWMAKFMLQTREAPASDKRMKEERQKIRASLLAQLTNHGVAPLDISGLLRNQTAISSLAGLTVMKHMGEVIPVVWRVSEKNITQFGLRNSDGGVCWLSTVEAAEKLASRGRSSPLSLSRERKVQQEQASVFWEQLVNELDQTSTLLLVNGEAVRMSFTHFLNRSFSFDRTKTKKLIVVRTDAADLPQYFANEEEKSKVLVSGFSGFYSHKGEPRRSLLLAGKGASSIPYKRSQLENRFLELSKQPVQWPELEPLPLLDSTNKEIERKTGAGQGAQMRKLVECVITDLPDSMKDNTELQQYIHGLVKSLQNAHIEYPECTNLPYPLHELSDFAADMIKITPVHGITAQFQKQRP
ncbi:RNaseH domain-containing protein [Pseudoalteromonas sp. Of7M-16]|uniref:RNaseH domain-containing protein n=1 Tax=Pseudoalteromonas sp. Of7M-16 TaxID=2917756 RepID=UPI001EF53803|nr:RNaseH domain-containing protein [Pseudoalteromonas sp. Of7M-16]MCG7548798.1 RNaseH domain-containing protein [Pseudoalteromonas sp. Of7M-16]